MIKKILVLLVFLLAGCTKEITIPNEVSKFKEEYEVLNDSGISVDIDLNAKISYLEEDEIVDFLNNETGIIYFGFPTCPWCRNILPILIDVTMDNDKVLYYCNPSDMRSSENDTYNKIKEILNDYLEVNSQGEKTLYVPDVYFIKNGKIISHHLGTVTSQVDPYISLTTEEKQELYNIYEELLNKIY